MIPKFRIYCYETQEMIVARDYRELAETVRYLDVIEKMETKEEATIESLKQAKQTNLSDMFAE